MRFTPGQRLAASIPSHVAFSTDARSSPSITISYTAFTPSGSAEFTTPRRVGQYASLVLAFSPLYLLPTLLPDRTTPPGNGMITPGTARIAFAAIPAADSFYCAEDVFAQELAVHRRHAPVALAVEELADLPAVAEVAEHPADA